MADYRAVIKSADMTDYMQQDAIETVVRRSKRKLWIKILQYI